MMKTLIGNSEYKIQLGWGRSRLDMFIDGMQHAALDRQVGGQEVKLHSIETQDL